jgi:NADH-quinone oxidoreductase subunit I
VRAGCRCLGGDLLNLRAEPITPAEYFRNIYQSVKTTLVGMRITGKYLMQKPITVQYPDERMPIPDRYRGIHYLEQEKCIDCLACARACPIDCIEMEAVRHGKELEWISFTLDYQKCMFCELCVYPCPKDCIHMGTEYAFVSFDRSEFLHDLLSFKGMDRAARIRMKEAEAKKKAKEEAKKAKAAAGGTAAPEDAAPAADEGDEGDGVDDAEPGEAPA